MTLNDPLANVLAKMNNYEQKNKRELHSIDYSKTVVEVLEIMEENGYIEGFEVEEDAKGDAVSVQLKGYINEVGAIKPRFSFDSSEFEKWEKRYLPARDFGIIIVSTSHGLMTHYQAKEEGVGGRLISYCY